jgi:hypothetical protein
LVWDFGGRLFDLFLEPFLGAKKSPFFLGAVPNQRENYQRDVFLGSWAEFSFVAPLLHSCVDPV